MAIATIVSTSLAVFSVAAPASADGQPDTTAPDVTQGPSVSLLDGRIRCLQIETEYFCTDLGFLPPNLSPEQRDEWLKKSLPSPGQSAKIASAQDPEMVEILNQLASLSPSDLEARQKDQIASARLSVGKVRAYSAIASGEPLPPELLASHPDVRRLAGLAKLRANGSIPESQGSTDLLPPASASILTGYAVSTYKQINDHYCGPATFQLIYAGNTHTVVSQTTIAGWLGTTTETGIANIVAAINSRTTWDDTAGTYTVQNVEGRGGAAWLSDVFEGQIGLDQAPIVLHPTLRTQFFDYINRDHNGHFQTGQGYTPTAGHFFEPYNEADFPPGGAQSAGYRYATFQKIYDATTYTSNPALRSIGY
jgi:hypothetical protein